MANLFIRFNDANFHEKNTYGSLGLLLLQEEILAAPVAPILSPERYEEHLPLGGTVTIAGYGLNSNSEYGKLQFGEVPIKERNEFEMFLEGEDPNLPDACFGDSGGPTYVSKEGVQYATGITSRLPTSGFQCGDGVIVTLPGSYLQWIENSYQKLQEEASEQEPPSDPPRDSEDDEEEGGPGGSGNDGGGKNIANPNIEYPSGGCSCSLAQEKNENKNPIFLLLLGLLCALRRCKGRHYVFSSS